jgi:hypothetical protein
MAGALTAAIAAAFSGGAAVVTDDYFEYTTLLLPGNGTNGAQNNTFLDGSTNNFTITRNGNTTQGTFSPFSQTGWGNYFKTGTDAITSASSSGFAFGTGNYTIEAQIYWSGSSSEFQITGSSSNNFNLYVNATTIGFYDGTSGITRTTTISKNTWLYIALVRSGGSLTFYLNGSAVGSTTASSTNYSAFQLIAGRNATSGTSWADGYISNLRVSNVARTISSTPTSAYTQDANTVFLLGNTNRFLDQGVNGLALTITGTPSVVAFSPFNPTASWSAATYGGSGYFDGNGDYLATASNAAFALGSGNFTIEMWLYSGANGTGTRLAGNGTGGSWAANRWIMATSVPANVNKFVLATNNYGGDMLVSTSTFNNNQWMHVAIARSGNAWALWVNGTREAYIASNSSAVDGGTSEVFNLGRSNLSGDSDWNGYVSGFKMVKGTAVYDPASTSITIPTAPPTNTTNTSLLLNFTNAGIYDATSKNDLETVGNAQISTAQSKWGGSSMYFDGTGDWLLIPDQPIQRIGTGNFTVEGWVYRNSSGTYGLIGKGTGTTGWLLSLNSSNQVVFTYGSSTITSTGTVSATTWTHIAVVREGTSTNQTKIYINGTNDGTGTVSTDFNQTNSMYVGADRTGGSAANAYMQDVRVTNYARYTANFTAPTAAFPTL